MPIRFVLAPEMVIAGEFDLNGAQDMLDVARRMNESRDMPPSLRGEAQRYALKFLQRDPGANYESAFLTATPLDSSVLQSAPNSIGIIIGMRPGPVQGGSGGAATGVGTDASGAGGGGGAGPHKYYFFMGNQNFVYKSSQLLRIDSSSSDPHVSVEAAFRTVYPSVDWSRVMPAELVNGKVVLLMPQALIEPKTEIHFVPFLACVDATISRFPLSDARSRIAAYARAVDVSGSVSRVPADFDTELRLHLVGYPENITFLIGVLKEQGAVFSELPSPDEWTFAATLQAPRFVVHTHGPKRTDAEVSMETGSESSYSIASPRGQSRDAALIAAIKLRRAQEAFAAASAEEA